MLDLRLPKSTRSALLAFVLAACSGGPSADAVSMRPLVEPHLEELAAYDRWARRLSLADSAFRSDEALAEAAFAPLRRSPRVLAAWLHREGPDERRLAHPDGAPSLPDAGWVRVRTEQLGELDARRAVLVLGGEERACILVRRSAPAPDDAVLHVTLAFDAAP